MWKENRHHYEPWTSWTRSKLPKNNRRKCRRRSFSFSVLNANWILSFSYLFFALPTKHKIPSNWKNRENIFLLFAAKRYINIMKWWWQREKPKEKRRKRKRRDLFNLIFGQSSSFAWLSSDAKSGGRAERDGVKQQQQTIFRGIQPCDRKFYCID
jgi:hypothetical protein